MGVLILNRNSKHLKRTTMKTLGIFACLLAVVFAAENVVADDKTVQVAESVDQLSEEQRRGGYRGGYGGGRRYGRSIADEAQELEVQEQRYGGYRGGYRGGYGGGRRYGRSIADEAQELEVQEQRYGGYRGGYRGGYGGGRRYG